MTEETTIEYIIQRIGHIGNSDRAVVCGKIIKVTVESNLLRQMGGSYTGDTIAASMEYAPEYLPCDFMIDNPDAKIEKAESSIILVKEVIERLARELDAVVCATMAQHEQTLQEALAAPKEVPIKKKYGATEVF